MVLDCWLSSQRYPVMLPLQAHLCSLYMRKCSFQIVRPSCPHISVSFMFAWLLSNTTTRGRSSESNWSPDLQFYSAVFSSRPISSQLLCSKCLSLRLADVNILKLTTSSQNLSTKSFNIPTSCSLDVSLSNYWLHCPQPRPEVLLCGPISENMDKINAEYGKKAQYQYVCPSDLQYKVPMSCPKHPVVSNLWMLVLNSGLFVIITVAWNVLMKCTRGLQKRTMPIFLSSNQAALKWTCESHLNPASDVHLFENEKEWPCSN